MGTSLNVEGRLAEGRGGGGALDGHVVHSYIRSRKEAEM